MSCSDSVGSFPQHRLQRRRHAAAGGGAERGRARGAEAAHEFETIAATASLGPDVQREALWRAAELYQKDGQRTDAAASLRDDRAPLPAAVPGGHGGAARSSLILPASADDATRGVAGSRDIVAADAAAGAARTDRSRYLAAHATLELAAPLRDAFLAVRLTAPLPKSLKVKKERMELALSAYGKAADYAVADVTTAATFETAELYYMLSRDLLDSEKPANLAKDETRGIPGAARGAGISIRGEGDRAASG